MISLEASLSRLTKLMARTFRGSRPRRRQSPRPPAFVRTAPASKRSSASASASVSPVVNLQDPLARRSRRARRGVPVLSRPAFERRVPPPRDSAGQKRQKHRAHDRQPERHPQQTLQDEEEEPEADEGDDDDGDDFHKQFSVFSFQFSAC